MRDFTFNDMPRNTEANINSVPLNDEPLPVRQDEVMNDNAPLRSFRAGEEDADDSEDGNNTAKIVGGIVFGLLIIGGGIYAYESSSANSPSQIVAMKSPAPSNVATAQPGNPPAVEPPTTATDTTAAPSQTSPDGISPTPSRAPSHTMKKADTSTGASAQALAPAPAPASDTAVNAPMTLTPETAPPAEQSSPAGQTAMQQPVTPPDVSGQTPQPAPEVANNSSSAVAPQIAPQLGTQSDTQTDGSVESAPATAQTDQSAQQSAAPAQ